MPVPSGYVLDNGASASGPPPGYARTDANFSSQNAPASQSQTEPSLLSDLTKYSPVGMVQGLASMIRTAASGHNPLKGAAEENAKLLDKAKDSFQKGDYGAAAGHFLNYLAPGGAAMEDISQDIQNGNYLHAAAKFTGLASSAVAGAKAPEIVQATGNAADAAKNLPSAVAAGARAGTPDVAAGAAKIAGGEVLAKLPGMEFPARIGMGYPGARQIMKGFENGTDAFRQTLAGKVQEATETATAEASDDLLNQIAQGYKYKSFQAAPAEAQQIIRNQADAVRASQQPRPAQAQPETSSQPAAAGQTPPVPNPGPARAAAAGKPPITDVSASLPNYGELMESEAAQPSAPSKPVAQQLFEELRRNGWTPPTSEPESALAPETGGNIRDLMREVPAGGARKAVADAAHAGGVADNPELARITYEAAARAEKADKMAAALHAHGITSDLLGRASAADLKELVEPLRNALGIAQPMSKDSLGEVMVRLQKLEGKTK